MAGERPFFIEGKVVEMPPGLPIATVKVVNGNLYTIRDSTPGISFKEIRLDQIIEIEITTQLNRVLSARIISDAAECDGSTKGS